MLYKLGCSEYMKKQWCFLSVLLYLPFFIEYMAYPLFMKIEPQWLAIAMFFILYTYLFYGLAIIFYHRWRRKNDKPIVWKLEKKDWKIAVIALLVGIVSRHFEYFILGESQIPMIIHEFSGYIRETPVLWMGIAGWALQLIYYFFEFTLVSCIVDCAQTACEELGWSIHIPWGGIFLGLTWGFGHFFTKNNLAYGISSLILGIIVGCVYLFLRRKPMNSWIAIAAHYLL